MFRPRSHDPTPGQAAALELLADFEFDDAKLTGFAGTGKTETIRALVERPHGLTVCLAAPTNKAVRVLRAKIGASFDYRTVDGLCGFRGREDSDGRAVFDDAPAVPPMIDQYDVVVVDEASMLRADRYRIMMENRGDARFLFVGDPYQLAPVGGEPSPVFTLPGATLTELVRQRPGDPLAFVSTICRHWIDTGRRPDKAAIAALPGFAPLSIPTMYDSTVQAILDGQDARVICYTNGAVNTANWAIHYALHGATRLPFVAGETILAQDEFKANGVRITNAEELLIRNIDDLGGGRFRMNLADDVEFTVGERRGDVKPWKIRHNYAMTSHKCQGSTFDRVMVNAPDMMQAGGELGRLLYVACSRPRTDLGILG
jgi:exodeoxyribonuclease-5